MVCKEREGEKPTGPTRLALGGAERKGMQEKGKTVGQGNSKLKAMFKKIHLH